MKEKAEKLRDKKVQQVFDSNALHDHQRNAAQKLFQRYLVM